LTEEDAQPVEHLDDDFTYELRATHEFARARGLFDLLGVTGQQDEESWFEVRVAPRQSLRRLEPLNKDVVWAIDTSASISPWYVNQMRSGVRQALRTLNDGDRFNILLFAEEVQTLSPDGLLEANDANIEKAQTFLNQAQASGGTDVNRALSQLLVRDVPPDRVYQIILLSDGVPTRGSINPRNIIDIITRENDRVASIYAVGVSDKQDRKLLELLAYRNKGRVAYPETRNKRPQPSRNSP
ncbi:MAG: VWA domain-containing protein, partial [Phycisphaeraceae bacterium]